MVFVIGCILSRLAVCLCFASSLPLQNEFALEIAQWEAAGLSKSSEQVLCAWRIRA